MEADGTFHERFAVFFRWKRFEASMSFHRTVVHFDGSGWSPHSCELSHAPSTQLPSTSMGFRESYFNPPISWKWKFIRRNVGPAILHENARTSVKVASNPSPSPNLHPTPTDHSWARIRTRQQGNRMALGCGFWVSPVVCPPVVCVYFRQN